MGKQQQHATYSTVKYYIVQYIQKSYRYGHDVSTSLGNMQRLYLSQFKSKITMRQIHNNLPTELSRPNIPNCCLLATRAAKRRSRMCQTRHWRPFWKRSSRASDRSWHKTLPGMFKRTTIATRCRTFSSFCNKSQRACCKSPKLERKH